MLVTDSGRKLSASSCNRTAALSRFRFSPVYPVHMFTVLQIDDLDSNLFLIERLLGQRPDTEVLSALTGAEGLAVAKSKRPNLILLDVVMPEMGGQQVLARLKSDPSTADIPVVVFSGSGRDDVVEAMLASGAVHFLPKPFTVHGLYDVVDSFRKVGQTNQAQESLLQDPLRC